MRSPKNARGLHASGLKIIRAFSANDVEKIKKESEGIVIPKSIGLKKRLDILRKSKELNVIVLNINADEYIKKIEEFVSSKKKKENKKKEQHQPKEQKESPEQKAQSSEKQKKEEEDKKKHKVLTTRQ